MVILLIEISSCDVLGIAGIDFQHNRHLAQSAAENLSRGRGLQTLKVDTQQQGTEDLAHQSVEHGNSLA